MAKTTKTDNPTISLTAAAKPYTIQIIGPTITALAQAAVHIRNGYVFCPHSHVDIFGPTGQIGFTLVLGTPEQHAIEAAAATTDEAVKRERYEYEQKVQAAARQMIEDAARAEKQAKITAEIAEQQKALRQLEAELTNA